MGFNEIVGRRPRGSAGEFGLRARACAPGYFTLDAVHTTATLVARAMDAGLVIFNLTAMEDVVVREGRVAGLVINWSAIRTLQWHVDPLSIRSRFVLDATGHPAEVATVLARKMDVRLDTATGGVVGEKSLAADLGEQQTVANTRGDAGWWSAACGQRRQGGQRWAPFRGMRCPAQGRRVLKRVSSMRRISHRVRRRESRPPPGRNARGLYLVLTAAANGTSV